MGVVHICYQQPMTEVTGFSVAKRQALTHYVRYQQPANGLAGFSVAKRQALARKLAINGTSSLTKDFVFVR